MGAPFRAPAIIEEQFGEVWAMVFPPLLLSSATILGIFASILWQLRNRQKPLGARDFLPLLISPIVLLVTYSVASEHPSVLIASLMAFQNGFFWQIVMSTNETR